jgi:hypothetical protein
MPADTGGGTPLPPQPGKIGIMLESRHEHGTCVRLDFEVKNSTTSPLDFDLPAQAFVRCKGSTAIYTIRPEDYSGDPAEMRYEPGETKHFSVPICHQCSNDDLLVGVMTSGYQSHAGTAGLSANVPTGGDTAIYFDWDNLVDGECSATQEPTGYYPEIEDPPAQPSGYSGYMGALGLYGEAYAGHSNGNTPVTIPPCLRITRGFGCSGFPTGVAGGSRCPPGQPYWHTGIDYSCYTGTPVFTPMGGALVHSTGTGYGNLAKVNLAEGGQSIQMYFAHLSVFRQSDHCHVGGICNAGSQVGDIGSTGFSTGPHLHWEIRVNGVPVDPFQYWSGLPEGGARGPVAGIENLEEPSGIGVLAAPPLLPEIQMTPALTVTPRPPARYPLRLRVRKADGAPIAGVEVTLGDSEGETTKGTCTTGDSGICEIELPTGVYQVRLGGTVDGHPIDPVGDVNVEALESGIEEFYFGPLAVWHDPPHSTVGFVLEMDDEGVLQPLIDADPTGDVPQPLNPMEDMRPEETPVARVGPDLPSTEPPSTVLPGQTVEPSLTPSPTPTPVPGGEPTDRTARIAGILLFIGGLGLVIASGYVISWLRKEREA